MYNKENISCQKHLRNANAYIYIYISKIVKWMDLEIETGTNKYYVKKPFQLSITPKCG